MASFFNEILKNLPPDLLNIIKIKNYSSNKISIVKMENAFSTPNAYDMYKFILPLNTAPYPIEFIEKNKYHLKKGKIFPINPGQPHWTETNNQLIIKTPSSLTIFIDKEFVQDTAKTIFGKKNIFFENKNSDINANLQNLINLFIEEAVQQQPGYQFILENLNLQITINLLRTLKSNCTYHTKKINYSETKSINYIINYLNENYDQDFSLEQIASLANYSPFHFIRLFKAKTGKTPFAYLFDIKINKAKQLLKNSDLSITDICFASGFNNRSHFSVVFKRKTGYSPSQYRKISQSRSFQKE
ncbi:MAG: helix-turn-helix domain-containing protein [Bacillota bacterium]